MDSPYRDPGCRMPCAHRMGQPGRRPRAVLMAPCRERECPLGVPSAGRLILWQWICAGGSPIRGVIIRWSPGDDCSGMVATRAHPRRRAVDPSGRGRRFGGSTPARFTDAGINCPGAPRAHRPQPRSLQQADGGLRHRGPHLGHLLRMLPRRMVWPRPRAASSTSCPAAPSPACPATTTLCSGRSPNANGSAPRLCPSWLRYPWRPKTSRAVPGCTTSTR